VLKAKQKKNYDREHRTKPQPELCKGDLVWIKNEEPGKVVGHHHNPRSLWIETSKVQKRRNCRDLNKRSDLPIDIQEKPKNMNTTFPDELGKEAEPLPQSAEDLADPESSQQAETVRPIALRRSARTVKPPVTLGWTFK